MATRGVVTALSRTGIAIAALMMALSVTVGVDLMVRSFRGTVTSWLEYALPADLYLSVFTTPARRFAPGGATLDQATVDAICRRRRRRRHQSPAPLPDHASTARTCGPLRSISPPAAAQAFSFRRGEEAAHLAPHRSRRSGHDLRAASPIGAGSRKATPSSIASPQGELELPIAGVFYDYSTEQGLVMLDRSRLPKPLGKTTDRRRSRFTSSRAPTSKRSGTHPYCAPRRPAGPTEQQRRAA